MYGYGALGFRSYACANEKVGTCSGRLPAYEWSDVGQFLNDNFWMREAACVLCVDNMPANMTIIKMQYICVDIGYTVCSDGVRCDDDDDCAHTSTRDGA